MFRFNCFRPAEAVYHLCVLMLSSSFSFPLFFLNNSHRFLWIHFFYYLLAWCTVENSFVMTCACVSVFAYLIFNVCTLIILYKIIYSFCGGREKRWCKSVLRNWILCVVFSQNMRVLCYFRNKWDFYRVGIFRFIPYIHLWYFQARLLRVLETVLFVVGMLRWKEFKFLFLNWCVHD